MDVKLPNKLWDIELDLLEECSDYLTVLSFLVKPKLRPPLKSWLIATELEVVLTFAAAEADRSAI